VGNDLGDTSSNNGNTFPSNYDALGSVYRLGLKFRF
jgi:iron complex outermembrane receptor protein